MSGLNRRLKALETSGPSEVSPRVKAWLGWPLTDAEALEASMPYDQSPSDMTGLSKEFLAWLAA